MSALAFPRLTPWVGRLIVANAVVLLVLQTVAPALAGWLAFSPSGALAHPWTFVTYMFVHSGLLHLAFNCLFLYFLGTAVEARMGSRAFPLFYLLCGLGGAVFSLALSGLMSVPPFVGASGAVLGVAVAFAMYWPDAEMMVFPIPFPIRARTLVLALVAFDVVMALAPGRDGVAHLAHLGGALVAYAYFRLQGLPRSVELPAPPRPVESAMAIRRAHRAKEPPAPRPRPTRVERDPDPASAEMDRVLDKISAQGIHSLTPEEKRFLAEASEKKRRDSLH